MTADFMHKQLFVLYTAILFLLQASCTTTQVEKPKIVGFAVVAPLQIPNRDVPIEANRTSILWGRHDSVTGSDVSFFGNFVEKEFNGTALSLVFHATRGKANIVGGQMSGLTNMNHGKTVIGGVQMAAGLNYSGSDQTVIGVQLAGLANIGRKNKVYGIQVGAYNEAEAIYGFQVGVINRTKSLHGIQIGLLNISSKNGLPFCPILNVGF